MSETMSKREQVRGILKLYAQEESEKREAQAIVSACNGIQKGFKQSIEELMENAPIGKVIEYSSEELGVTIKAVKAETNTIVYDPRGFEELLEKQRITDETYDRVVKQSVMLGEVKKCLNEGVISHKDASRLPKVVTTEEEVKISAVKYDGK